MKINRYPQPQQTLLSILFAITVVAFLLSHFYSVDYLGSSSFVVWRKDFIRWFSFFTTLTNFIVMIATGSLLFGRGRLHRFFSDPAAQGAICLYYFFVGFGYWALLGGPDDGYNSIIAFVRDNAHHTFGPIVAVVYFLFGIPKGTLRWAHSIVWLVYPISYLVYWLFRGPIIDFYPYFFVDVSTQGYHGVAMWMAALMTFLLILGWVMWGIDWWMGRFTSDRLHKLT